MSNIELEDIIKNTFLEHYNYHEVTQIKNHLWRWDDTSFLYSGQSIINKIPQDANVIDIGCGYNFFKKHLPNLIGIDLVDVGADIITSLADFKTNIKFDVAICFGSMQFGNKEYVLQQLQLIDNIMNKKSKLLWKFTPHGCDVDNSLIRFFLNEEILTEFATQFGYIQTDFMLVPNMQGNNRGYATWTRNDA